MLSFQEFFALGVATMASVGALLVLADRIEYYLIGRIASFMVFFPTLYAVLIHVDPRLGRSPYVDVSAQFTIFQNMPSIIINILFAALLIPVYLYGLTGKRLGIAYLTLGSLVCFSIPWSITDTPILILASVSAVMILAEGSIIYTREKHKEDLGKELLSVIRARGEATVEDIMTALRMPDTEVREILYDLWMKGKVEKREERTRDFYRAVEKGKE
jgi:predicted transcriptional regulator